MNTAMYSPLREGCCVTGNIIIMPCLPIVFFSTDNSWPVSPEETSLIYIEEAEVKRKKNLWMIYLLPYSPAAVQYSTQPVFQQDLGIEIWNIFPAL